jgi:hypothetical protein
MRRIESSSLTVAALLVVAPLAAHALTPGQAYHKATQFLRSQAVAGFESHEAQPVLLGEAIAGDPLAAGPRSTTLLASLELGSVDARGRRARTLGALKLAVTADVTALKAARTPSSGYGVDRQHLPSALDTALAVQALDAAGTSPTDVAITQALEDLTVGSPLVATSGMWPLLRIPDAAAGGVVTGDVATTAQVVLALRNHLNVDPDWDAAYNAATAALAGAQPTGASEQALRLLALLEWNPTAPATSTALDQLVAMQDPDDGSFGDAPLAEERVYATALAARAIWRSRDFFPFNSDTDALDDGPDPDSDNDGICDPGEVDSNCSGSDAFPSDPLESADLDLDGIGDDADPDDDGDGLCDPGAAGTGCSGLDYFPTDAAESADLDLDGTGDNADVDDDNDGLSDVEELLAALDPKDADTDGDSFRDDLELAANSDPLNLLDYPLPDGDVFPLGAPDGVVDLRDELLAHRILRGLETVPSGAWAVFLRHADVAPLDAGAPAPNSLFEASDVLVITRRARGIVAGW